MIDIADLQMLDEEQSEASLLGREETVCTGVTLLASGCSGGF